MTDGWMMEYAPEGEEDFGMTNEELAAAIGWQTREQWLLFLTEEIRPWFNGELPPTVRVSVGFTSKGLRSKRVGECWSAKDHISQIFVHPILVDPVEVAATLAHEMCHACRPKAKHGPKFKELATLIGLEGKMVSTVPGEQFKAMIAGPLERVGPYPHEAPKCDTTSVGPKQTTRMLKMECAECGYLVRGAKKWVEMGVPDCPCCKVGLELEQVEEEAA